MSNDTTLYISGLKVSRLAAFIQARVRQFRHGGLVYVRRESDGNERIEVLRTSIDEEGDLVLVIPDDER